MKKAPAVQSGAPSAGTGKAAAPKNNDAPKNDAPKTGAPNNDAPKTDASKTGAPTGAVKDPSPKADAGNADPKPRSAEGGKTPRFVATEPTAGQTPAATKPSGTSEAEVTPVKPAEAAPESGVPAAGAAAPANGLMATLMVLSFVLEVALMGALGIWGLTVLSFSPIVAVLVAVVPLLVFWGFFMSPKASLRLSQPYHAIVAHLLFALGAVLLAVSGHPVLAMCMGALTAISLALTVAVRGQNVASRKKSTGRRAAR